MSLKQLEQEIIATLDVYLLECQRDDEDCWITREKLHELMNKYKGSQ